MIYTQSSAQIEINTKIDSLIKTSIQNKNFPGAQLYVKIKDSIIGKGIGGVALQIHDGGGIKVRWKDLKIQKLYQNIEAILASN